MSGLEGKSLSVLTPMYGNGAARNYVSSMLQLVGACGKYGVPIDFVFVGNESLIPRGRNRLVDTYLKRAARTHAVFIDADIGFYPDELLSLLYLDLDVAGAPCPKKSLNWGRIKETMTRRNGAHRPPTEAELGQAGGDFVFNLLAPVPEIKLDAPLEVRQLGTGLMMIKREVFETYAERYPDRWYESRADPGMAPGPTVDFFRIGVNPDTREYESEDFRFCEDCRALGFKIWVCPWVRTTHVGSYEFIGDMPGAAALAGRI